MIILKALFDINNTAYIESVPNLVFGNNFDGVNYIFFESELEKYEYFNSFVSIDAIKKQVIDLIDEKSQNKIFEGFFFDNKKFSLSLSAQINWSNLLFLPSGFFPINLSTKNDDVYSLTYENVQSFYNAALNGKNLPLQEGNILKQQVKACQTIAELDVIKQNL